MNNRLDIAAALPRGAGVSPYRIRNWHRRCLEWKARAGAPREGDRIGALCKEAQVPLHPDVAAASTRPAAAILIRMLADGARQPAGGRRLSRCQRAGGGACVGRAAGLAPEAGAGLAGDSEFL
jgi:hypothetical protein